MFHCIQRCYDGKTLWSPGDTSETIPAGMKAYFKPGPVPKPKKEEKEIVALSQFARPAFDQNPSEKIPISQYGKPSKKK